MFLETYACVNVWLADTGKHAGVALQLNSDGQICFAYDRKIPVTVTADQEKRTVALHAPILSLSDMESHLCQAVLVQTLTWNLPGMLEPGLAMAADEDADQLYLVAQSPLDALDTARFQLFLSRFMVQAENLCRELRNYAQSLDERPSRTLPGLQGAQDGNAIKQVNTQSSTPEEILQLQRSPAQLWG